MYYKKEYNTVIIYMRGVDKIRSSFPANLYKLALYNKYFDSSRCLIAVNFKAISHFCASFTLHSIIKGGF